MGVYNWNVSDLIKIRIVPVLHYYAWISPISQLIKDRIGINSSLMQLRRTMNAQYFGDTSNE